MIAISEDPPLTIVIAFPIEFLNLGILKAFKKKEAQKTLTLFSIKNSK